MNVNAASAMPLLGTTTNPSSSPLGKGGGRTFSLGKGGDAGPSEIEKLRQTTGQVVGSVFFGTLLKTMRESKLNGTIGHGGRGEEVFSAQLHGMLAEKMGESEQSGVAEALFRHLRRQQMLIGSERPSMIGEGT